MLENILLDCASDKLPTVDISHRAIASRDSHLTPDGTMEYVIVEVDIGEAGNYIHERMELVICTSVGMLFCAPCSGIGSLS